MYADRLRFEEARRSADGGGDAETGAVALHFTCQERTVSERFIPAFYPDREAIRRIIDPGAQ